MNAFSMEHGQDQCGIVKNKPAKRNRRDDEDGRKEDGVYSTFWSTLQSSPQPERQQRPN